MRIEQEDQYDDELRAYRAHAQTQPYTGQARLRNAVGFASGIFARSFALLTAGIAVWLFAYIIGFSPWLGRLNGHMVRNGASVQDDASDFMLGTRVMFLMEGQVVFVRYDSQIRGKGELRVSVRREPIGSDISSNVTTIRKSGAGQIAVPIIQSGFYTIIVEPFGDLITPSEMYYRLEWGALWSDGIGYRGETI